MGATSISFTGPRRMLALLPGHGSNAVSNHSGAEHTVLRQSVFCVYTKIFQLSWLVDITEVGDFGVVLDHNTQKCIKKML